MKILALEFSSPRRSVALVADGRVAGHAFEHGDKSSHPFRLIEAVLHQAQARRSEINRIAVGLGPGSYAGVRSAIALAQGWALARAVRVQGLSSMESLAAQAQAARLHGRVHFLVDAQREEFYIATYAINAVSCDLAQPLRLAGLSEAAALVRTEPCVIAPELAARFPQASVFAPDAAALGMVASRMERVADAAALEPIYLRTVQFVKVPPLRPG